MTTLLMHTERIAAAGCSRAAVSSFAGGAAAFTAVDTTDRGWSANPAPVMSTPQVKTTKRHAITPAPRPEDGSP